MEDSNPKIVINESSINNETEVLIKVFQEYTNFRKKKPEKFM